MQPNFLSLPKETKTYIFNLNFQELSTSESLIYLRRIIVVCKDFKKLSENITLMFFKTNHNYISTHLTFILSHKLPYSFKEHTKTLTYLEITSPTYTDIDKINFYCPKIRSFSLINFIFEKKLAYSLKKVKNLNSLFLINGSFIYPYKAEIIHMLIPQINLLQLVSAPSNQDCNISAWHYGPANPPPDKKEKCCIM